MKALIRNGMLIRHKIGIGFGTVLFIMAGLTFYAIGTLSSVEDDVTSLVETDQPLVIRSLELQQAVFEANSYLGFYLLSVEDAHKAAYESALERVNRLVAELLAMAPVSLRPQIEAVKVDVDAYAKQSREMLVLPTDPARNQPAMAFASANMNPLAVANLQVLSEMLLSEEEEDSAAGRKELLNAIQNLRYAWVNLMNELRVYLSLPNETALANLETNLERPLAALKSVYEYSDIFTFEQDEGIDTLQANIEGYIAGAKTIIEIQKSEKRRMDTYLVRSELGPLVGRIATGVNNIVEAQRQSIQHSNSALVTLLGTSNSLLLTLLGVGMVLGIAAARIIGGNISCQLSDAVDAMRDVAEGDGDLTRRLSVASKDEIGQLSEAFNKFAERVADLVGEVAGTTQQLAVSSAQMKRITGQAVASIQSQGSQLDSVVVSMASMSGAVSDVERSTAAAASTAEQADASGRAGQQVVAESIATITRLSEDMQSAAGVVQELNQNADEIGSVLDVIQGIAEQTNLLALNAAIEAARAGEQGRGFAVVADEVRTLASRTQQSTQEIKAIIERLQAGSGNAVNAMDGGQAQVERSVDYARKVGEALQEVAASVTGMLDMNNTIVSAAQQQSDVTGQVNAAVAVMKSSGDEVMQGAAQIDAASSDVTVQTDALQRLVGQFKI